MAIWLVLIWRFCLGNSLPGSGLLDSEAIGQFIPGIAVQMGVGPTSWAFTEPSAEGSDDFQGGLVRRAANDIRVFAAFNPLNPPGRTIFSYENLANVSFPEGFSRPLIVSDASADRVPIFIDFRLGSAADEAVTNFLADNDLPTNQQLATGGYDAALVRQVADSLKNWMQYQTEFPWDRIVREAQAAPTAWAPIQKKYVWAMARAEPLSDIQTDVIVPLVPIERVLQLKRGTCLEAGFFLAAILGRLGIQSFVRPGSNHYTNGLSGHTWVELNDGMMVDIFWRDPYDQKRAAFLRPNVQLWEFRRTDNMNFRYPYPMTVFDVVGPLGVYRTTHQYYPVAYFSSDMSIGAFAALPEVKQMHEELFRRLETRNRQRFLAVSAGGLGIGSKENDEVRARGLPPGKENSPEICSNIIQVKPDPSN